MTRPRLLVAGGLDPSGGAGLDADRDALVDLAVDARFVATAHTDQDDGAVRAIGPVDVETWTQAAKHPFDAIKFGLLPGAAHVRAAAALATGVRTIVVDPVIAASSGGRFLDSAGVAALRDMLLAAGVIVTPNLDEAAELTGVPRADLEDPDARVPIARELIAHGARAVVLKAGHGSERVVRDLVLEAGGDPHWLSARPRIDATLRGTGCRFATALAAHIALGAPLVEAAEQAAGLVADRLRRSGA
ncbi:MAG: hydroxymethylpyrimidine/phosphomethylpyrimidine kinase [bacterium]|nr:hydroxymethylpyrimidine/phosphomethylpyrimidine kinase [bacterium]